MNAGEKAGSGGDAPPSTVEGQVPEWLRQEYPFEPKSTRSAGGARLSYLDEGPRTDEAVLMLHGNPTWSFYYRKLVRALRASVRCVVPDHIGMGLSQKPSRYRYDLTQRIDDVAGLVEQLGLKRIHLVVHDWGGAIGFGLATRHPELIGRIGIMNTAAFYLERIPARIALCRVPLLGALVVRGFNGFAGPATVMAMHNRSLTPTEKRGYLLPYDSWAHRVAVHRFVRDIPMERNHPTRPALEQISSRLDRLSDRKMMIVWGRRDFCFDDAFLRHWTEIYPQAEVRRFNDAGHYVLEDAGETAVNLLADFVR